MEQISLTDETIERLARQVVALTEAKNKLFKPKAHIPRQSGEVPASPNKKEEIEFKAEALYWNFLQIYEEAGLRTYIKPSTKWKKTLALMMSSDELEMAEINQVIAFAAKQTKAYLEGEIAFRVQAPDSLRKKYQDLKAAMNRKEKAKGTASGPNRAFV